MPAAFEFPRSSKVLQPRKVPNGLGLTLEQAQLVYGTMLGDAHMTQRGTYHARHSYVQREYLWHKYMLLQEHVRGVPSSSKKRERGYQSVLFWTAQQPVFRSLRTLWYPEGVKVVTPEILQRIDQIGFLPTVAWWFADDGSRSGRADSPTMIFCTHGFQHAEVELLRGWMTDHGYPSRVLTTRRLGYRPYPVLYIRAWAAVRLMEALTPFTPPCMHYKLQCSGRNDREICMFCGNSFRLKTLRRRTDLPWFPCCETAECCAAKQTFASRRYQERHPESARRRRQRYRDYLQANPEAKARQATNCKAWAKDHPERMQAAKQRYLAKQRTAAVSKMLPCRVCGSKPETLPKHGRSARRFCAGECLKEHQRRLAKIRYYKRKASRSPDKRGMYEKLIAEVQSLYLPA